MESKFLNGANSIYGFNMVLKWIWNGSNMVQKSMHIVPIWYQHGSDALIWHNPVFLSCIIAV